jgi:lysozyme family protein
VPDPFTDKYDCNYSAILDRENLNRIVALFANKKGTLPQLPWSAILGDRLIKVSVSKEEAFAIKQELMPKETNNFYSYRRNGITTGYIMFAFQICR